MNNHPSGGIVPSSFPALSVALAALGLISTAQAQLQVAGSLLVDVDVTGVAPGALNSITNNGSLGGFFEARGGGTTVPVVGSVSGNGTRALLLDGDDFLQHVSALGGPVVPAAATLVGANPSVTIEAWVLNPGASQEETIVSWGKRGGPDGSNMSFNYGWDDRWGSVGHWGGADLGWDPCCNSGSNPPGVPKSGVWHHLVYTYDGTIQKVYEDGVLKNSETVSLGIHSGPPVTIGAQIEGDGTTVTPGLRGTMALARLRVHSEALSDSQVASNYAIEKPNTLEGGSALPFGPVHRYSFNNASGGAGSGSVVTDSISGADGVVRGGGATFTGDRLVLPGGSPSTAAYVDLPNGLLSTNSLDRGGSGGVTFEGWVKVTGSRNWGRILDFGSTTGGEVNGPGGGGNGLDYLFLTGQEGGNGNRHVVDINNFDGEPTSDPAGPAWDTANFNRDYHFALSWDEATGEVLVYENGALVSSFSAGSTRMSHINDVNVWLGRSNWAPDQNLQGEYDEFRIYNRVLPADQVRASYAAGPNALATAVPVGITTQPQSQAVQEYGTATFSVTAEGAPPIGYQWYTNGVLLAGAAGSSITFSNAQVAANGMQVSVVVSNNISGNAFYATSQVAMLTVLADTNAPTLLQARVNSTNTIEVIFSEDVVASEALNKDNYSIPGFTILSAAPGGNSRRVILTIDGTLSPFEFYQVSVSNVHDLASGANVTPPGAAATLWNYSAPGMTHRYTFNTAPNASASGAAVVDMIGTNHGTIRSAGGPVSLTGSRVALSGGSSATAPYVDLPNGLLSSHSTNNGGSGKVTFEFWYRFTGNHNWQRVLDFGSSGPCCTTGIEHPGPGGGGEGIDYLFYSQVGTTTTRRRIDLTNRDQGDHGTVGNEYNVLNNGQDTHVVISWDEATGQIITYENGVQVASMTTVAAMSEINDVNVWLGRSNWTGDGNMQGEIDEFRVYNTVVSPADVQRNASAGADNNFGALLTMELSATNQLATNSTASFRVLGNFSNAGLVDLTGSAAALVYSSTDSNVVYLTPDGTMHAGNVGAATISVSFNGITDTMLVEVSEDSTPPTLVSARSLTMNSIEIVFSEPVDPASSTEALYYLVSGPTGEMGIIAVTQLADPRRVILTLDVPMPSEWITVVVNEVQDQSPLRNTIEPGSSISFLHFLPQGLAHRYSFNNVSGAGSSGTVIPDAAGTNDAILLGAGAAFTGDRVALPGGSGATAAYVDLPNNLLSTNSVINGGTGKVSIEGWIKITGVRSWARVFDFGSSGPCCSTGIEHPGPGGGGEGIDYLFYSASIGSDRNNRQLEVANRDEANQGAGISAFFVTNFNQDIHFVLTWDEASGLIELYENGQLAATLNSSAMSRINDVNVWLGRSNWTQDENMQGEFDEFRIYNRILTAGERELHRIVGPNFNFGEPLALRASATNFMHVGQAVLPAIEADFASIAAVDLSASGVTRVTSSNPAVINPDAAGVLRAVGPGTATITFAFSGFSQSVEITVNAPPVGGDDGFTTAEDTALTIDVATLLANDTDADANTPLTLASVSATSVRGGTVSSTATSVTYTPATNFVGGDSFTYTVQDTRGGTDSVTVHVFVGERPASNHVAIAQSGSNFSVNFTGAPGTVYQIQRTTSMTAPVVWETISTQTAPPHGSISFSEPPPGTQAFYRVIAQ